MIAEKIIRHIENWAPPGIAWEKDNVGLQVGSTQRRVTNIFLCLELSEKALNQAINKKCNLIFTHHPIFFKPKYQLNTSSDSQSKLIEKLIKNDITLFSSHTNLDFTKDGVSFALAKRLKLEKTEFLLHQKTNQVKLIVFVPTKFLEKVSNALFSNGAGIIGEYENCSFNTMGFGTFKGSKNSNPLIGKKLTFEKVDEIRLEVLVDSWKLNNVIDTLKKVHPYEEPAYDIYPLQNENVNYGFGVIGYLMRPMKPIDFLNHISQILKINNLKYVNGKKKNIRKVAVCGGSGSDLLEAAIKAEADAFVTADIKYHRFFDAAEKILFIDAGHYETEVVVLDIVKKKLEEFIKVQNEIIKVYKYSGSTNPVKFFNKKGVRN